MCTVQLKILTVYCSILDNNWCKILCLNKLNFVLRIIPNTVKPTLNFSVYQLIEFTMGIKVVISHQKTINHHISKKL
jgi:hypothetical protein